MAGNGKTTMSRFAEVTVGDTNPITLLEQAHLAKLALCDRLESIADLLPGRINMFDCAAAAQTVTPLLSSAHRFEEDVLFPFCAEKFGRLGAVGETIGRLTADHREDAAYGEEVAEVLAAISRQRSGLNGETVGFMLRGFFAGLRRHIAAEREFAVMVASESASSRRRTGRPRIN